LETAGGLFQQAETLLQKTEQTPHYWHGMDGLRYSIHLRRLGNETYSRQIAEATLEICKRNEWPDVLSYCHLVLGDLDTDISQFNNARQHHDDALKIARSNSRRRDVLIEALLTRGRWAAKQGQVRPAFNNLDEALGYTVDGGYRIYETDIRNALAWAHLAAGQPDSARAEATRARRMSEEMGYYWGQADADEVLGAIGEA